MNSFNNEIPGVRIESVIITKVGSEVLLMFSLEFNKVANNEAIID